MYMRDIRYLLSIKELLEEATKDGLAEIAYAKMDSERREKAKYITNETKRAESIGAGLLLQLGLQEICRETSKQEQDICQEALKQEPGTGDKELHNSIPIFTVSQVLAKLKEPIEVCYKYGENNKPYFKDCPWYFNISHSKEYVLCVLSKQEVGVDIQYKRTFFNERILHRFFTEEEKELWEKCTSREERDTFFYRMWTAKEALGKLTGEGIIKAVSVNVVMPKEGESLGVIWEHCDCLPEYAISICKRKETKEQNTK